jgi:CHAT domain-containing protein
MSTGPAVIHFGTHFIEAAQSPRYQMIALSLAASGELQFLSPLEITRSRTKAALVVLNGCRSGQAEILPAAGLMGLTRAWLVAGARAAVATHWSTPDDNGAFFISFYGHLKKHPDAGPSEALRRARLDMLRAGGWRSNPQYWATYFLLGDV